MSSSVPIRLLAILGVSLLSLTGCQSPSPPGDTVRAATGESQQDAAFVTRFQSVLYRNGVVRNERGLPGVVKLRMTVDAHNQVLDCTARTRPPQRSHDPQLRQWVTDTCWNSLFPPVPAQLFANNDDTHVVQATLVFLPRSPLPYELKQQRKNQRQQYLQSRFFREHLLLRETLDSIGVARFQVSANVSGQVQDCQVQLEPSPYRPTAFKDDGALRRRLSARCRQLDLRQMPGFAEASAEFQAQVAVEYSPWLKQLPSP